MENLNVFNSLPEVEVEEWREPHATGSVEAEGRGAYLCQLVFLDEAGNRSHSEPVFLDKDDPDLEICDVPYFPGDYVMWCKRYARVSGGELGSDEIPVGDVYIVNAQRRSATPC